MHINPRTSPEMIGFISVMLLLISTFSMAVPVAGPPVASQPSNTVVAPKPTGVASTTPAKPVLPTAQQFQQQIKQHGVRIHQLEEANQNALARNQELQLMNDNLAVQVQVLQSERSAQMFLYGAATLAVGAIIGFILCNSMLGKRSRRW